MKFHKFIPQKFFYIFFKFYFTKSHFDGLNYLDFLHTSRSLPIEFWKKKIIHFFDKVFQNFRPTLLFEKNCNKILPVDEI